MKKFEYNSKGHLIVLGRYSGVAQLWGREFNGFLAWFLWGLVHIFNLIGIRNRLMVFINWVYDFLFFEKVERVIVGDQQPTKSNIEKIRESIYN